MTDTDIDRILFAIFSCHDGSELWAHGRRDPDAFRNAVKHALKGASDVTMRELREALKEALDGWAVWAFGLDHPERSDSITDAELYDQAKIEKLRKRHGLEAAKQTCSQCGAEVIGHHACEGVPGGFGPEK